MTTDEGEQTWDEGRLTEHDVIEAADGTGYTSVSAFVAGENGYEPDGTYASDSYDAYDSYASDDTDESDTYDADDADDIDDSGGF
ncbi:hypothetical protein [Streptomyces phaeofaciens]|uniref:hypothetical protein n=1 Tax=Streptomyces phaeofaciens TaxID=68254 RepID=UPI0036CF9DBB